MKFSQLALSFGVASAFAILPIDAILTHSNPALAQTQQALNLTLEGHKRQVQTNAQGLPEVVWVAINGGSTENSPNLRPGDVVRYTIRGNNRTDQPISGLVLNDDIPSNMIIVLGSATVDQGAATLTYSADGGQTYSRTPMIRENRPDGTFISRPAEPEEYTHVRWSFTEPVAARSAVQGSYQVRLR